MSIKKYKNVLIVVFFLIFGIIASNLYVERFLTNKEIDRNIAIIKDITSSLIEIEKSYELALNNAIISLRDFVSKNNQVDRLKLQKFRNKLKVSNLYISNANGITEASSRDDIYFNPKVRDFYKTFSLFDVCSDYKNLKQHNERILILPTTWMGNRKIPSKIAMMWDKSLNKFLGVHLDEKFYKEILDSEIILHSNLKSVSLSSPSGQIFITASKERINNSIRNNDLVNSYSENIVIKNNKNLSFQISFGGLQTETCEAKAKKLTNNNNEYFYVLSAEFSKQDLNNQLTFVRITFFIITILIFIIIYFVNKAINQKDDIRLALKKQAFQIHHDIASPIQALDWRISSMTKERRVMEGDDAIDLSYSVETIRDVLADMYYLHDHSKTKEFKITTELVYPIIYSTFCSARLLLGYNEKNRAKLKIEQTKDFNLLINTDRVELRRVMLNLIKNAIESKGDIRVSLTKQENNAIITIKDTGCGIPPDILKKLMSGKTVTDGKPAGRGLGFSYAKYVIDKLGGTIKLESELNKGTTQTITFPLSNNRPSWFVERLNLEGIKTVVIVDDYEPIHKIWQDRLKDKNINTISCFNVEEFEDYMQKQTESTLKETFFLVDYSLQTLLYNGIILIAKHNLQERAILVTSKYLEASIKDTSAKNNIKIMPKEFIGMVEV